MSTRSIILLIFIVLTSSISAQVGYNDLTNKIKNLESPDLEKKVEILYSAQLKKTPNAQTKLKFWKFYIYDSLGVYGKADTLAAELKSKANELKDDYSAFIFSRLGDIEVDLNQFEKAINLYHSGLKIAKKYDNQEYMASFKRSIGTAYLKLDQNNTAEKYLRESLSIYTSIEDTLGMANASISLGNAMKDQGNLDDAEMYYKKSLVLAQKLGNNRLIAGNYNNLGNVERRRNKHRKALEYFFKALEMNKKSGNVLWESFNYHNIGNAYSDLKEHEKAIDFFILSNKLKLELGDSLSLVNGYLGLSDAYAAISDYKNAYAYLRLHSRLEDTLQIAEQAAQLKELEAIYESEKKEAEILQLTTEKELEEVKNGSLEMKAQKNRNLLTLAIFAGLILLVGIGLLWRANKSRRKANDLLNSKNELIEKSNVALQSALGELSEKNKEIIDSINYATYIQRATLPNITQHSSDSLQFELFFAPKDIVSGDFYFSYQLYNKSIFGVADCTGHGVPGAMVSLVGMNSLEKVIREEKHVTTGEMVESLNAHVVESLYRGSETLNDGMDISFCHFDHENNMLYFTGANHSAYILRQNSFMDENVFDTNIQQKGRTDMFTLLCLSGTRRPIGKSHSNQAFAQISIKLLKGDRIVLFSDGYADQIGGEKAKKLKKGAMLEFILRSGELPVSNQAEFMNRQFDQWKGDNEQVDDVCMLFIDVKM